MSEVGRIKCDLDELIINITQSNCYFLCGEICDNPRFVFNIVIITYIPALKLDLFPWKTHCVQIHGTTNIVRWIHLNYARVNYLDLQSNVAPVRWSWVYGCELFRMKRQRNYRHQSKITGLRSALSCIKAATNHTFCSMKCRFYAGTLVCGALQHICEELS